MHRRKRFAAILAYVVLAITLASRDTAAQDYPQRPITMIVPLAAGGPTDTIGRLLGEYMKPSLGQPVVVENVGGASGSIGVGRVARAAPDGHTIVLGHAGTFVVNGAVMTLPYDLVKDFEPVGLVVTVPYFIIVRKSLPADDLKGLIAWLRANPDKASQATAGNASQPHLAGVLFQKLTGTRYQFVPYRGTAPAIQGLIAEQTDLMMDNPANSLEHVRAGLIKAFAVTSQQRFGPAPDVPTVDEAGLPGFHIGTWFGIWAPKATPKPVIEKLNAAVRDALANPAVRTRLTDLGQEIFPAAQQTPEALAAFQKAEIDKWWPIIQAAGIKAQ